MKLDATYPALDLWHYQLRKGLRTTTTFDSLWAAACEEMAAREFVSAGAPEVAGTNFRHAYDAMTRAAA